MPTAVPRWLTNFVRGAGGVGFGILTLELDAFALRGSTLRCRYRRQRGDHGRNGGVIGGRLVRALSKLDDIAGRFALLDLLLFLDVDVGRPPAHPRELLGDAGWPVQLVPIALARLARDCALLALLRALGAAALLAVGDSALRVVGDAALRVVGDAAVRVVGDAVLLGRLIFV